MSLQDCKIGDLVVFDAPITKYNSKLFNGLAGVYQGRTQILITELPESEYVPKHRLGTVWNTAYPNDWRKQYISYDPKQQPYNEDDI